MKHILTIISIILLATAGQSTDQYPDKIILEGKAYELEYCYPLEPYFELHPELRPEIHIYSTGLYRGYVATFEVREDIIYVVNIEVQIPDTVDVIMYGPYWISVIDGVFPRIEDRKLGWINEILTIPPILKYKTRGERLKIKTIDNHYVFLEVHDGVLVRKVRIKKGMYKDYATKMFNAFKQTIEYPKVRAEKLLWFSDAEVDEVIRDEILYISKHLVDK